MNGIAIQNYNKKLRRQVVDGFCDLKYLGHAVCWYSKHQESTLSTAKLDSMQNQWHGRPAFNNSTQGDCIPAAGSASCHIAGGLHPLALSSAILVYLNCPTPCNDGEQRMHRPSVHQPHCACCISSVQFEGLHQVSRGPVSKQAAGAGGNNQNLSQGCVHGLWMSLLLASGNMRAIICFCSANVSCAQTTDSQTGHASHRLGVGDEGRPCALLHGLSPK